LAFPSGTEPLRHLTAKAEQRLMAAFVGEDFKLSGLFILPLPIDTGCVFAIMAKLGSFSGQRRTAE